MYKLICQKPAHFVSAQIALVSTFFQMFIVLGTYNFGFKKGKEVVSPCFWYKCDIKQKKLLVACIRS